MNNFVASPKKIFLLDGLGAMISWFFLYVVLMPNPEMVGLPSDQLRFLAIFPIIFAMIDAAISFAKQAPYRLLLKVIVFFNISYCILTAMHLFVYADTITALGYFYFIGEIVIILLLVMLELKVIQKLG